MHKSCGRLKGSSERIIMSSLDKEKSTMQNTTIVIMEWYNTHGGLKLALQVYKSDPDIACHLPHMLSMAALKAKNLRRLTLQVSRVQPVLHSLAYMSQITELTLYGWKFSDQLDASADIAGLRGLCALEVTLPVSNVSTTSVLPRLACAH